MKIKGKDKHLSLAPIWLYTLFFSPFYSYPLGSHLLRNILSRRQSSSYPRRKPTELKPRRWLLFQRLEKLPLVNIFNVQGLPMDELHRLSPSRPQIIIISTKPLHVLHNSTNLVWSSMRHYISHVHACGTLSTIRPAWPQSMWTPHASGPTLYWN